MPRKKKLRLEDINIFIPPQLRGPIEPELNPTHKRVNQFVKEITQVVLEICEGYENAPAFFINTVYKNVEQSSNYFVEITSQDRLLALVYVRRTELNHQEETFFLYKEVFHNIEQGWKDAKKDLNIKNRKKKQ